MHIQHKEGGRRSMFYIEEGNGIVAEIVYAKGSEGVIVIEHTEVNEELQGQHIGFELVQKVVDYARAQGVKISPVCPFAKAVFDRRTDFKDVLA